MRMDHNYTKGERELVTKTSSARKRKWGKQRVDISDQRWRELMKDRGLQSDTEVVSFLWDR